MVPDNATPTPTETAPRAWVWWCDDASIAAGQTSVLAVAEVFAAVALYWWLALHFDWPWLSLLGLIAAPMLLLRSPESVELGVEMLRRWNNRQESGLARWETVAAVLCGSLASFIVIYILTYSGQSELIEWGPYWRVIILSGIGSVVALAAIAAVWGKTILFVTSLSAVTGMVVIRRTVASRGLGAFVVALVSAVLGVLTVTLLIIPSIAIGLVLLALYIRLIATYRHLLQGIALLPQNWHETLTCIDLTHPPELLPQAGSVDVVFTASGLWQMEATGSVFGKLLNAIFILVWYLPALAYRWSLKASAWLWWPLALALTPGLVDQASRERAAHTTGGAWAFPVLLPVSVLAWLALSAWPGLQNWLALLPEVAAPAQALLPLLTPPPPGLRYGLLWLAPLLALALWWRRKNLSAAYATLLGSPKEWNELGTEDQARFQRSAAGVERLRLLLIVALILLGEAIALSFAHDKNPQMVERLVWPWLLEWL